MEQGESAASFGGKQSQEDQQVADIGFHLKVIEPFSISLHSLGLLRSPSLPQMSAWSSKGPSERIPGDREAKKGGLAAHWELHAIWRYKEHSYNEPLVEFLDILTNH